MNDGQLEKMMFVNGELNALMRQMGVGVTRVKSRQSGTHHIVTIEYDGGDVHHFDATDMSMKQIAAYALIKT